MLSCQDVLQSSMRFCWTVEFYDCTYSGSCEDVRFITKKSSNNFQIWNTSTGHLLAEWKPSDGDNDLRYSCIASSFTGEKVV